MLGLGIFWILLPKAPADIHTSTDGVVVLTGGSGRVQLGFSLIEQGLGKKLLISGVNPTVKMNTLFAVQKTPPKDSVKDVTDLGYEAENTQGNAQEAARWAQAENIKSLRLVTSSYHIPRSIWEFSKLMPNVSIIPHPITHTAKTAKKTLYFLVREYHKFVWARWVSCLMIYRTRTMNVR
jgi:uncharacterized SAM-binding protein YcdF (DUF218 family)